MQEHCDKFLIVYIAVSIDVGFAYQFLTFFLGQFVAKSGEHLEIKDQLQGTTISLTILKFSITWQRSGTVMKP